MTKMEESKSIILHLQSPDNTCGIQNALCYSWNLLKVGTEKSFVRKL